MRQLLLFYISIYAKTFIFNLWTIINYETQCYLSIRILRIFLIPQKAKITDIIL